MKKRFLSMMLTVMMVLSLVPAVGADDAINNFVFYPHGDNYLKDASDDDSQHFEYDGQGLNAIFAVGKYQEGTYSPKNDIIIEIGFDTNGKPVDSYWTQDRAVLSSAPKNVGTYKLWAEYYGKGEESGSTKDQSNSVAIDQKSIANAVIYTLSKDLPTDTFEYSVNNIPEFIYDGSKHGINIIKITDKVIKDGNDQPIELIKGQEAHVGTVEDNSPDYYIENYIDAEKPEISIISVLSADNAGTYYIYVTGTGNYKDYEVLQWKIAKADPTRVHFAFKDIPGYTEETGVLKVAYNNGEPITLSDPAYTPNFIEVAEVDGVTVERSGMGTEITKWYRIKGSADEFNQMKASDGTNPAVGPDAPGLYEVVFHVAEGDNYNATKQDSPLAYATLEIAVPDDAKSCTDYVLEETAYTYTLDLSKVVDEVPGAKLDVKTGKEISYSNTNVIVIGREMFDDPNISFADNKLTYTVEAVPAGTEGTITIPMVCNGGLEYNIVVTVIADPLHNLGEVAKIVKTYGDDAFSIEESNAAYEATETTVKDKLDAKLAEKFSESVPEEVYKNGTWTWSLETNDIIKETDATDDNKYDIVKVGETVVTGEYSFTYNNRPYFATASVKVIINPLVLEIDAEDLFEDDVNPALKTDIAGRIEKVYDKNVDVVLENPQEGTNLSTFTKITIDSLYCEENGIQVFGKDAFVSEDDYNNVQLQVVLASDSKYQDDANFGDKKDMTATVTLMPKDGSSSEAYRNYALKVTTGEGGKNIYSQSTEKPVIAKITPRDIELVYNVKIPYGTTTISLTDITPTVTGTFAGEDTDDSLGIDVSSIVVNDSLNAGETLTYNTPDGITYTNTNYNADITVNVEIIKAVWTEEPIEESNFYKYSAIDTKFALSLFGENAFPPDIIAITPHTSEPVVEHNDTEGVIIDTEYSPAVDDSKENIVFALVEGLTEASIGDSATMKFVVTSKNYEDFEIHAKAILVDNPAEIKAEGVDEVPYDGEPEDGLKDDGEDTTPVKVLDEDGNEVDVEPDFKYDYDLPAYDEDDDEKFPVVPENNYTEDNGDDKTPPTLPGHYTLTITIPDDEYNAEEIVIHFTIYPLEVIIQPESYEIEEGDLEPEYALNEAKVKEQLLEGDKDKLVNKDEPEFSLTDSDDDVVDFDDAKTGTYDINLNNHKDVYEPIPGYYFTTAPGTLTVGEPAPKDNRFYWSLLHLFSQQFKITADCNEGGIVSPEGVTSVYFDESVDYTITPYEGYEIVSVLIDDVDIGAVEEYTFKRVQEDHTITAVFQEIGWENPFTDVSESAWYYDAVEYVNENGLMLGTNDAGNLFAPDQNLNRATVVTALWRLEGSPIVHAGEDFLDVEPDMWYTQAVRWATSESIVLGFDDNTFRPLDDVTHEQVCAFLHRYAKYKGIDDGMMLGILPQYEYSAWAENDVIWAETYGILNAVPDIFDLTESATRAHFAAYMFQFAGLDEE